MLDFLRHTTTARPSDYEASKKIVKENQKKVKKFVVVSLSSKENDARKENIAMKKILIQSRKRKINNYFAIVKRI